MNKEHEEQADKLIEQYRYGRTGCVIYDAKEATIFAVQSALIDNQNTIDALSWGLFTTKPDVYAWQQEKIKEHKAIQTILKSKLK